MIRRRLPDLGILILLLLLPLLLFGSVVWGSKTLLPADILFSFEPFNTAAADQGVAYPHNHLLGDLILQNYPWKRFLSEAIRTRQLPLWDPYTFAGHPFLANGQHSALYPLNVIFYTLPLRRAYGVFTWVQLGLAGAFAYLFARVLGVRRLGGLISGITYQFSGFMVVSVVHPMIIAGASWLPLILAMIELVLQQRPALGGRPASLPWTLLGAAGIGCQVLAGHAENTYFVLLVTGLYASWRLAGILLSKTSPVRRPRSRLSHLIALRSARHDPSSGTDGTSVERGDTPSRERVHSARDILRPALWLALMVVLGLALGTVQLVPLYEVASTSFRGGEEAASLQQVLSWAYPPRRLVAFAIPNFFGNPAHHSFFDLFSWRQVPALDRGDGQYVYWGIKNYVEGGAYLGLLPVLLSILAVVWWSRNEIARLQSRIAQPMTQHAKTAGENRHTVPFFALLSLFSLGCMFGTPLYAAVYALPFLKQSHSPFRWVFPLTLSIAVLAGFGIDAVQASRQAEERRRKGRKNAHQESAPPYVGPAEGIGSSGAESGCLCKLFLLDARPSPVSVLASLAFWGGLATLGGLSLTRLFFARIEPVVERLFLSLAGAPSAFVDHRAFYSYEAKWVAVFGLLLTASGIVLRVSRCPIVFRKRPVWEIAAVVILLVDFVAFGAGFHPAVDPSLLDYTPSLLQ